MPSKSSQKLAYRASLMLVLLILAGSYSSHHGVLGAVGTIAWIGFLLLGIYFVVLGLRTLFRRARGAT